MKNECSIVRDLLPLYFENMVSTETAQYVKAHLQECATCRAELERLKEDTEAAIGKKPTAGAMNAKPFKRLMKRINRQTYSLSYAVIVIFILLGFSLTGGSDLMYNSLIMPIVGVFGYFAFHWRAVYKMPLLLLAINFIAYGFHMADIDFASVFPWTLIYSIFVFVGVAIAYLLHFALRRE